MSNIIYATPRAVRNALDRQRANGFAFDVSKNHFVTHPTPSMYFVWDRRRPANDFSTCGNASEVLAWITANVLEARNAR